MTTFSYIPFQTLGANLVWRSASEGITVSVDMTVTLFNKEQFAENRYELSSFRSLLIDKCPRAVDLVF